jgi:sugar-specific transcriptional regulator TrmB
LKQRLGQTYTDEEIETLLLLGLTFSQAKILITLTRLGEASTEEIAQASNTARPNIYQTIESLQKLGLVEKNIVKPLKFRSINMRKAIQILLADKGEQYKRTKLKAKSLLARQERNTVENIKIVNAENFVLLPKKFDLRSRIFKALEKASSDIIIINNGCKMIERWGRDDLRFFKELSRRGVKIRYLTNCELEEKDVMGLPMEIRIAPIRPPFNLVLIDKSELFFGILDAQSLELTPHLWSKNSCMIALTEGYFEQIWEKSKRLL